MAFPREIEQHVRTIIDHNEDRLVLEEEVGNIWELVYIAKDPSWRPGRCHSVTSSFESFVVQHSFSDFGDEVLSRAVVSSNLRLMKCWRTVC